MHNLDVLEYGIASYSAQVLLMLMAGHRVCVQNKRQIFTMKLYNLINNFFRRNFFNTSYKRADINKVKSSQTILTADTLILKPSIC